MTHAALDRVLARVEAETGTPARSYRAWIYAYAAARGLNLDRFLQIVAEEVNREAFPRVPR